MKIKGKKGKKEGRKERRKERRKEGRRRLGWEKRRRYPQ